MKRHYVRCRSLNKRKRVSVLLKPDEDETGMWFLGMPGAAVLLTEDQMIQLGNTIADLLESAE